MLSPAFADARPTDAEREVWEQVDVVLKDAKGILDELQAYKGAGQEIREVHPIHKSTWGREAGHRAAAALGRLGQREILNQIIKPFSQHLFPLFHFKRALPTYQNHGGEWKKPWS